MQVIGFGEDQVYLVDPRRNGGWPKTRIDRDRLSRQSKHHIDHPPDREQRDSSNDQGERPLQHGPDGDPADGSGTHAHPLQRRSPNITAGKTTKATNSRKPEAAASPKRPPPKARPIMSMTGNSRALRRPP